MVWRNYSHWIEFGKFSSQFYGEYFRLYHIYLFIYIYVILAMYMLDSDQEPSYYLSKNLLLLPRILKLIEDMVDDSTPLMYVHCSYDSVSLFHIFYNLRLLHFCYEWSTSTLVYLSLLVSGISNSRGLRSLRAVFIPSSSIKLKDSTWGRPKKKVYTLDIIFWQPGLLEQGSYIHSFIFLGLMPRSSDLQIYLQTLNHNWVSNTQLITKWILIPTEYKRNPFTPAPTSLLYHVLYV